MRLLVDTLKMARSVGIYFLGRDGRKIKIEEKFRTHVWNDFLIEILQDVLPPMSGYKLGWFYHCKSEQVINVFVNQLMLKNLKRFMLSTCLN